MNILLPNYALNYNLMPFKTEEESIEYDLHVNHKKDLMYDYIIYWGHQPYMHNYSVRYGVMETGFFHEAAFIDTIGNYQTSSLNTKYAFDIISNFDLGNRKSAKDIIFNLPTYQQSKYNADFGSEKIKWKGVVLAVQNPSDRSINIVTNINNYYKFIEKCCKFYGKNLFVKMHPWNSGEIYKQITTIAKTYNCSYGYAPVSIIDECEFVISYNSTFAIDCILRDIPYVQYGMGTFFNAFGIHYSNHQFPTNITKIENSINLANFLVHKYCYKKDVTKQKYAEMIKHFSVSNDMFPMTDQFSFASNY